MSLVFIHAALASAGSVTWSPPFHLGDVHWGVAAGHTYKNWAYSNVAAFGVDGATMATTDGLAYTKYSDQSMPATMIQTSSGAFHTYGALATTDASNTSWNAPSSDLWQVEPSGLNVTTQSKPVTFSGLPTGAAPGKFTGATGLRFGGTANVVLNKGSGSVYLQTSIVSWPSPKKNNTDSTSIVLWRSDDGYAFEFLSTVADAADHPSSDEGPNEHAMEVLADGSLLVVFRVDCGDGPRTHRFAPYMQTRSTDGGKTWSAAIPAPGAPGCAYPHLLRLKSGPLLLTGGRAIFAETDDNDLWVSWAGDGSAWERHAVSYAHNLLAPTGAHRYYAKLVNGTENMADRQTSSYTSLVPIGDYVPGGGSSGNQAIVAYDLWTDEGERVGYAMRVELNA